MTSFKEFVVRGVKMQIPNELLSARIEEVLSGGKYEHLEANQIPRVLRKGDRVLEFGAGVGFLSTIAYHSCPLETCVVIEANPLLIPVIKNTHEINGVSSIILNAVAVSRASRKSLMIKDEEATFFLRKNFWESSLSPINSFTDSVKVPVVDMQKLIDLHKPTVIIMDIEGGEINLFDRLDLSGVRHILMETHKNEYSMSGIGELFEFLAIEDFFYDPDYSVGAVVTFTKAI